jgi:predicted transcriptional regulator
MSEKKNTMGNADRFLNAFATIEKCMKAMLSTSEYVTFGKSIEYCSDKSKVVRENARMLNEYRQLRNAIVHQRDDENEPIAEPSDFATQDIERIAQLLMQPASVIGCATSPVKTAAPEDTVADVYARMKTIGTSKMPVFDQNHFAGMLTPESICNWASAPHETCAAKDAMSSTSEQNRIIFMAPTRPAEDALQEFEQALTSGRSLLAIIITADGTENGEPLGIITVHDLPKVLAAVS